VWASFSTPVQTGPGTHPASYTMSIESFQGLKRPGRDVNHPPPSSAEVKERVELYVTPRLCLHGRLQGNFTFLLVRGHSTEL
jgi:hypothetical protein